MAISPMASRAMALSYSRLDRLVRIDTAGWRTIRIVWIVNTLLALSTMRSQADDASGDIAHGVNCANHLLLADHDLVEQAFELRPTSTRRSAQSRLVGRQTSA
jgi:hypothetical protein